MQSDFLTFLDQVHSTLRPIDLGSPVDLRPSDRRSDLVLCNKHSPVWNINFDSRLAETLTPPTLEHRRPTYISKEVVTGKHYLAELSVHSRSIKMVPLWSLRDRLVTPTGGVFVIAILHRPLSLRLDRLSMGSPISRTVASKWCN